MLRIREDLKRKEAAESGLRKGLF
ncbi:hypothetical protein E2C01_071605 [Portunus trituberculatus]|uniref:Uncharacterized protein n=1 Tax=Portunus trituberculatus TaxID=210409 RepID=A0A5B7I8E9_PORTR|nr:hypothetical protein [Portunus trituberculatus]